MKQCVSCRELLPLESFNSRARSSDGLQNVCRDCNKSRARRYYAENRERHLAVIRQRTLAARMLARAFIAEHLLSHPCVDCGENDLRVLDFDHLPDSSKSRDVMWLARSGYSIARLSAEIAKCEVRCRNCHAIVTSNRRASDWRREAMSTHSASAEAPGPLTT